MELHGEKTIGVKHVEARRPSSQATTSIGSGHAGFSD
jgi:hypothetical protein